MHRTLRSPFSALGALLLIAASTGCPNDADTGAAGSGGTSESVAGQTSAAQGGKTGTVSGGSAGAKAGSGGKAAAGSGQAGSGQAGSSAGSGKAGGASPAGSGAAGNAAAGAGGAEDEDAGVAAGQLCGTRGARECAPDQFCNFAGDKDCGGTDRGGVCADKPEVCTAIYAPVCGCDNRTHGSACTANSAGISVLHDGACTAEECAAAGGRPELSDGASTPTCADGEESWNIGETDEPALCCLPRTQGATCGGFAALECQPGEFCNYEEEAGGQGCNNNIADGAGRCQETPSACTREFQPVCGCDRHSYSNTCEAHTASTSVFHQGFCTVSDCDALGGRAVAGIGPAPMCASDEHEVTSIVPDNGSMPIEGMICCVKN